MNHTLSDIVYLKVKQYLENNQWNPTVIDCEDDSIAYPKVVIKELENVQSVRDGNGFISYSIVRIEIDIQAVNQTIEEVEYSGKSISLALMDDCDIVCNQYLGLNRESYKPVMNTETGIYRLTVVYKAIQDDMRNVYY